MIELSLSHTLAKKTVTLAVAAEDSILPAGSMYGTVAWGDGQSTAISGSFPLSQGFSHTYTSDGLYLIQVSLANRRAPRNDTARAVEQLELATSRKYSASTRAAGFIRGPILPRSVGYPTSDSWCFNMGLDSQVLESNLMLILMTSFGERLMDPSFGTGLRQLVFESDTRLVETVVREEVSMAVAKTEPRVNVDSIKVARVSDQDVNINLEFSPKDKIGEPISVALSFTS